jgi:EAL domain-containing protein (putative c-di-GMP-specific phosphodiesterase class I)
MAPVPISVMKFDRAFVPTIADSLESTAIVHTMMQLDKVFGFQVMAGGLEGEELPSPRADGIDLGYGFLFTRSMTDPSILSAQARQRVVQR